MKNNFKIVFIFVALAIFMFTLNSFTFADDETVYVDFRPNNLSGLQSVDSLVYSINDNDGYSGGGNSFQKGESFTVTITDIPEGYTYLGCRRKNSSEYISNDLTMNFVADGKADYVFDYIRDDQTQIKLQADQDCNFGYIPSDFSVLPTKYITYTYTGNVTLDYLSPYTGHFDKFDVKLVNSDGELVSPYISNLKNGDTFTLAITLKEDTFDTSFINSYYEHLGSCMYASLIFRGGFKAVNGEWINYLYHDVPITAYVANYNCVGDVDCNGVVDANDASLVLERYKSGDFNLIDLATGDLDNNNLLDANDASLILELYKTNN